MPSYANFLKDMCTNKKKLMDVKKVVLTEQCSAILMYKLPLKKKDLGSFTISCTFGNYDFKRDLIDLGARFNLCCILLFRG